MSSGVASDPCNGRFIGLPLEERLATKTVKTELCWIWIGSADEDGYGWLRGLGEKKRTELY